MLKYPNRAVKTLQKCVTKSSVKAKKIFVYCGNQITDLLLELKVGVTVLPKHQVFPDL